MDVPYNSGMTLPVRPLPVLSNWDCAGCSNCCRTYHVRVNETEKRNLLAMDWSDEPSIAGRSPVVYDSQLGSDRVNHDADGACLFLGPDNRCRIHDRFGSAAKPLACRMFPFLLVPAGDHWRVGLRFACPTVVANRGRSIAEHADDLREYARLYEADIKREISNDPPPVLQSGQTTTWPDLIRFATAASALLTGEGSLEYRIRTLLSFVSLMRKSRFEKVAGGKLSEFLMIVSEAVKEDTPVDPGKIPQPGFVGRSLFRQAAAIYARKDVGQDHGDLVKRGVLGRIAAGWRFAVGRGTIPTLHAAIPPSATFEIADRPVSLSATSQETIVRYLRTKIESLQFCGRPNFGATVWDGLEGLILTYPIMMWLARVIVSGGKDSHESLSTSLRIVDDNYGFNPLLGSWKSRMILSLLRQKDELPRLVAAFGQT